ncbi:MAG: class I SAM-dependent methyltransferase [Actinomycetota bacterium]|nr:class I SAM-dependent methyltransferase [Actinomycetota bacterium]
MKDRRAVNKDKFDRWAQTYDTDRISSWFRYIHQVMLEHIELDSKKAILDVGCGTGSALMLMARDNQEAKYCGIDLSSQMIEMAKKKTRDWPQFEFKVADSAAIPYPEESFDLVISSNSFHHYPEPLKVLTEIKRVMHQGGMFFLEDACRDVFLPIRLQNTYRRMFEKGHINYYTTKEILNMLKDAGFSGQKLVDTVKGLGIKKKAFTGIGMFSAIK